MSKPFSREVVREGVSSLLVHLLQGFIALALGLTLTYVGRISWLVQASWEQNRQPSVEAECSRFTPGMSVARVLLIVGESPPPKILEFVPNHHRIRIERVGDPACDVYLDSNNTAVVKTAHSLSESAVQ
jgi:hypothetical protein